MSSMSSSPRPFSSSEIDKNLARDDFCNRLCLVRTPPSSRHASPTRLDPAAMVAAAMAMGGDAEVDCLKLWPALRFDSHGDLVREVRKSIGPSDAGRAVATLTVVYRDLVRRDKAAATSSGTSEAHRARSYGVAYLLGRGRGGIRPSLVLIPPRQSDKDDAMGEEADTVFDFYCHIDEMEGAEGEHTGSEEFQAAYKLAMDRMEELEERSMASQFGVRGGPSPVKAEVAAGEARGGEGRALSPVPTKKEKKKGATIHTVNSARKTFSMLEFSPSASSMRKKHESKMDKMQRMREELEEDEKATKKIAVAPKVAVKKPLKSSLRRSFYKREEEDRLPVKTMEFDGEGRGDESVSSLEEPVVPAVSNGKRSGSKKMTSPAGRKTSDGGSPGPLSLRNAPWPVMMDAMKADGWTYRTGSGLIAWMYVHPSHKNTAKLDLIKNGKEGEDYFGSEEGMQMYAREHLGWRGEEDASPSEKAKSPTDADMADRVKKRKRQATCKPEVALATEVKKGDRSAKAKAKSDMTAAAAEAKKAKSKASKKGKKKLQQSAKASKAAKKTNKAAARPAPSEDGPSSPASDISDKSRFSEVSGEIAGSVVDLISPPVNEKEAEPRAKKLARDKKNKQDVVKTQLEFDAQEEEDSEDEEQESEEEEEDQVDDEEEEEVEEEEEESESEAEDSSIQPSAKSDASAESASSNEEGTPDTAPDSPSDESSEDPTYRLMKSMSAWRLLMDRFGFAHHEGRAYCLPGKENRPGKDSSAIEGVNYFATLEDLRKHLCAYGLPDLKHNKDLSEEERVDLARWVRYAHVSGLRGGELMDPRDVGEPLTNMQAWKMLSKLGMKYGGSGYVVPNEDRSKEPFKFDRQEDFLVHLARFGIPRVEGLRPEEVLEREDRLRLDLYIATAEVDTFKRINPGSEDTNEISPLRTRSRRSGRMESELAKSMEQDVTDPAPLAAVALKKNAQKQRAYQTEFYALKEQRVLPTRLLTGQQALSILVDNYNVSVSLRKGQNCYFLPGICLPEREDEVEGNSVELGVDYFDTLQDLRGNLCAFGLPPLAKSSKLSDVQACALESWVRCANIDDLCEESSGESARTVPVLCPVKSSEARAVLKKLGYRFCNNSECAVLLPGTNAHDSILGDTRFESIEGLFNNIARFGLARDTVGSDVSEEERLNLEIFIVTRATFDVSARQKCKTHMKKMSPIAKKGRAVAAPPTVEAPNTAKDDASKVAAKPTVADSTVAAANTPNQAAILVNESDQDTPQPSPPKRARTNTITKFLKKVGDTVVSTFSPVKDSPFLDNDASGSHPTSMEDLKPETAESASPASSSLGNLSASCLDGTGDDEVEACFAEVRTLQLEGPSEMLSQEGGVRQDLGSQFATLKEKDDGAEWATSEEHGAPEAGHYPQAERPDMRWKPLWSQMKKSGWTWAPGSDNVVFYYIHPSAAKMKRVEMLKKCIEGVHYFTKEEDIRRYAKENLGWMGEDCGTGLSPMQSEVLKSPRARACKQSVGAELDAATSSTPKRSRTSSEAGDAEADSTPKQRSSPRKKLRTSPGEEKGEASDLSKRDSSASKISGDVEAGVSQSEQEKVAVTMTLPENQPTVGEKLHYCQFVCHPSFNNKNQLVSSNAEEIKDFMEKSIMTGTTVDGLTLRSPGFMYICGGPGTGKTTAVKSCVADMKKWAKANRYNKPNFCFMNMASLSSCKDGIMRAMLHEISKSMQIEKGLKLGVYEKHLKKKVLILILDEIDMLFKQHGGKAETWFQTLVGWAEDKDLLFSMIGISNCVNDVNALKIREQGHHPIELIFSAYKEEELVAILEQRLGKKIVDLKALQLVSRRVAALSGDARRALEITSNAVGKCKDALSKEKLQQLVTNNDECMPLVKLPHMMRAIRESMPMRHTEVIAGLPQAAKVILCIAVSLSQVWGPTAEISISMLKKYSNEASHHAILDDLDHHHILNLVEMLVDAGLLITGTGLHFNREDLNAKMKIGVQLDDVEIALEESLLSQEFYRSLVDYVKRECPCPGRS